MSDIEKLIERAQSKGERYNFDVVGQENERHRANAASTRDLLWELAEALQRLSTEKAATDELLRAAVEDYNEVRAQRDMAERAAVEAAIPLEALMLCGQGSLSGAIWDGVRNGVGHVRSMLAARAKRRAALKPETVNG